MTERQLDLTNCKSLEASPCSTGRCYGNVRAVACVWAPKKIVKALNRRGTKQIKKKTYVNLNDYKVIFIFLFFFKKVHREFLF